MNVRLLRWRMQPPRPPFQICARGSVVVIDCGVVIKDVSLIVSQSGTPHTSCPNIQFVSPDAHLALSAAVWVAVQADYPVEASRVTTTAHTITHELEPT